ncbi:MAG TPA: hypothetical protein PKD64_12010 [Pirellulaceae bacterium]|nr:hypothetical protein [Pirellulaceae bacterium]HMO92910.1 hypothetical protein [Pirellulaceae bacterium]HMP69188.1 hypothetical protein [Pirellulaceae bacterium]
MAKKVPKTASKKETSAEVSPKKKKKAAAKKSEGDQATVKVKKKRVSRKKKEVIVRKKLFWGVYNYAMKRVAMYEHNQKRAAEKRARELEESSGKPHFVAKIKDEIAAESVEVAKE